MEVIARFSIRLWGGMRDKPGRLWLVDLLLCSRHGFLHMERRHLREAWVQIYKFDMAAIFQCCGDMKQLFGHSLVCEKAIHFDN